MNLRIKKRASGAFSPDIDPYSRETKETSIDKPIRMSRYLEQESQKVQMYRKNSHILPTGQWYAPSAVINIAKM